MKKKGTGRNYQVTKKVIAESVMTGTSLGIIYENKQFLCPIILTFALAALHSYRFVFEAGSLLSNPIIGTILTILFMIGCFVLTTRLITFSIAIASLKGEETKTLPWVMSQGLIYMVGLFFLTRLNTLLVAFAIYLVVLLIPTLIYFLKAKYLLKHDKKPEDEVTIKTIYSRISLLMLHLCVWMIIATSVGYINIQQQP